MTAVLFVLAPDEQFCPAYCLSRTQDINIMSVMYQGSSVLQENVSQCLLHLHTEIH